MSGSNSEQPPRKRSRRKNKEDGKENLEFSRATPQTILIRSINTPKSGTPTLPLQDLTNQQMPCHASSQTNKGKAPLYQSQSQSQSQSGSPFFPLSGITTNCHIQSYSTTQSRKGKTTLYQSNSATLLGTPTLPLHDLTNTQLPRHASIKPDKGKAPLYQSQPQNVNDFTQSYQSHPDNTQQLQLANSINNFWRD
ncbi:uncharacterized protein LOC141586483 isoform X3 [Silene latifolia]|uniref:uncharacterized protein LOC141586483 isoform X3 n=1 Tax=Silene latifolia TaxID=37657 RepID=UPI003D7720F2